MENTIIKRLNTILPKGFEFTITEELNTKMISFKKYELNIVYIIQNITLNERVHGDVLGNILGKLIFKEIEYILNPKYKIGENNPTLDYYGHQKALNITNNQKIFSHLPLILSNEENIDKACQLIQQYINQEAIPFFNYWQDIRDFLPFLETDDISILSDIFSGDALLKKIIIWKLCSHPNFNEFTEKKTNQLTKRLNEIPKDKSFKKNYDRYLKILKTLEKTKPLYEWDEKYLIQKPYIKEDLA